MPVVIDRGPLGYDEVGAAGGDCLEVAFVNNMPDKALEATERQFLTLLELAAERRRVRVTLYSLPDVPRTDWGEQRLWARYAPIADLWNSRPDALIVTGTEPRAVNLPDEPYWDTLARLVDWAQETVVSSVWSCLAAHAAVRHLDGIDRYTLDDKCFGVFDCVSVSDHALTQDIGFPLRVPHSRWNELRADDLGASGYAVLTRSAEAGVDTFVKRRKSLFVFFQGHPEYEPETLWREYRRDVGRFLKGERATYPAMPQGAIDRNAAGLLAAFAERAMADRREGLLAAFPNPLPPNPTKGWALPARRIYRNWLSMVYAERPKTARTPSSERRRSAVTP
jgi:homoserine O-succinyltransferase/O-acetyltransferase